MSEANMYVFDSATRKFVPWDGTVAGGGDGGGTTGGATEETLAAVRDRLPLGAEKTPNFTSTTGSGTVTAGAQSVAVANIGGAAGTLKSQAFPANAVVSWSVINPLDTLGAIAYDATGTTFLITEVR